MSGKYVTEWRVRRKRELVEMFGGRCLRCGHQTKCMGVYCFHHVEPSNKLFTVTTSRTRSFDAMVAEAKKCLLLCLNCHAEVHEEIRKG
jgi:hypothetical protein